MEDERFPRSSTNRSGENLLPTAHNTHAARTCTGCQRPRSLHAAETKDHVRRGWPDSEISILSRDRAVRSARSVCPAALAALLILADSHMPPFNVRKSSSQCWPSVAADFCSPDSAARSIASCIECADVSPQTSRPVQARPFVINGYREGLYGEAQRRQIAKSIIEPAEQPRSSSLLSSGSKISNTASTSRATLMHGEHPHPCACRVDHRVG